MARRCDFSGKGVQSGNNVSHAHNKTRRRFLPNMQSITMQSDVFGKVKLSMTTHAIRSIEKNGGLDAWLVKTPARKLSGEALSLKKRLEKAKKAA